MQTLATHPQTRALPHQLMKRCFALQPPSPRARPWGDLGIPVAHLGSRPAEPRESSCLGRNHTGLDQQVPISISPAALSMLMLQTHIVLSLQLLGLAAPSSYDQPSPDLLAQHPAERCSESRWPGSRRGSDLSNHEAFFGLKEGVWQDGSDAAAPCHSGDLPGATEPSPGHRTRGGWITGSASLGPRSPRETPDSAQDGCKDLGWLWAVPERWQGGCGDRQEGERGRAGWAQGHGRSRGCAAASDAALCISASHGFQRQIGVFLSPGSLQNIRP